MKKPTPGRLPEVTRFLAANRQNVVNEYEAPNPEIADFIFQQRAETDRMYDRLERASIAELLEVARNTSESNVARANAIMFLMASRDIEITDLLLELFDDPDQDLWRMVARSFRCDDPRLRAKMLLMLDDPENRNWSEAALALARIGDETLLQRLVLWLRSGDEGHRNVAVECLKQLKTPPARKVLEDFWNAGIGCDAGIGDDGIRFVVAAALLDLGDLRGREVLGSTARCGQGSWAVFAATSVYFAQPREGLQLMLQILDDGDLEARQSMVGQIWNFAHLPHAFTRDGLSEARVWVQLQLDGMATDFVG